MTSFLRIVGIDPGPTPGVVALDVDAGVLHKSAAFQCSADGLELVVWAVLCDSVDTIAQIERFVARGRANAAQSLTRDQVGDVVGLARRHDVPLIQRNASQVKAWATDERLAAAGLLDLCKGMRHARDAARHALFAAVHDGGLPDPMSKEWNR